MRYLWSVLTAFSEVAARDGHGGHGDEVQGGRHEYDESVGVLDERVVARLQQHGAEHGVHQPGRRRVQEVG